MSVVDRVLGSCTASHIRGRLGLGSCTASHVRGRQGVWFLHSLTCPWSLSQLDHALFIFLIAGFVFMGIGLLLGIYVHKLVYGIVDLTSPRLIFSFFIWLFYLALLLFRLLTGLRGRIPAQLAACGFSCAALSFLFELHIAG